MRLSIALLLTCTLPFGLSASWQDIFSQGAKILTETTSSSTKEAPLSSTYQSDALKEALSLGVEHAIKGLSNSGFLNHDVLKIPMPDSLKTVTSLVSKFGGQAYVDEFVTSLNMAAGKAVPETATIFAKTIKAMSVEDATAIIKGNDNAATMYFKEKTSAQLTQTITPIVKEATASNRLTASYQNMLGFYNQNKEAIPGADLLGQAKGLASAFGFSEYVPMSDEDLDAYVTRKTMDGMFWMIAEEEKKIRQNPLSYGSNLIQKVFGK